MIRDGIPGVLGLIWHGMLRYPWYDVVGYGMARYNTMLYRYYGGMVNVNNGQISGMVWYVVRCGMVFWCIRYVIVILWYGITHTRYKRM